LTPQRIDERWDDAPLTRLQCSVDTKGRLKLPTEIQRFLERLKSKLFVTTWSGSDFQVYTREGFVRQIRHLEQTSLVPEHRDAAKRQIAIGKHFGAEVDMDSDGRILLPPALRQQLGIEKSNASFSIIVDNEHFIGTPSDRYDSDIGSFLAYMAEDSEKMNALGRL
jgi:DNA-binding transcriptional regulator/RsmH inhibitor MraZ